MAIHQSCIWRYVSTVESTASTLVYATKKFTITFSGYLAITDLSQRHLPSFFTCSLPIYLPPLRPLLRLKLLRIGFEEVYRLLRLILRDVAECRRGNIVRLALTDERIVFENELNLTVVGIRLVPENLSGFISGSVSPDLKKGLTITYSEISSNFISVPRASLAAFATSSPLRRAGPVVSMSFSLHLIMIAMAATYRSRPLIDHDAYH
jgi:hypothetical protein